MGKMSSGNFTPDQIQEMSTLAKSLDELGEGGIEEVADLLTQRFKSLEAKGSGKDLSHAIELVGFEDTGLVDREELVAANQIQMREHRISKQQKALRNG